MYESLIQPPTQTNGAGAAAGASAGPSGDGGLFDSLLWQESRGKQTRPDGTPVTSSKGAIGIAQVMPGTAPEAARLAGLEFDDFRYRTDADYNRQIGKAYFDKQLTDFGDEAKALAAYNAGPAAMRRAIASAERDGTPDQWLRFLPAETQAYVPAILAKAGRTPGAKLAAPQAGQPAAAKEGAEFFTPSRGQYASLITPPLPERTAMESAKDTAVALGSGLAAGTSAMAGVFGADNAVARGADQLAKDIEDKASPYRKEQRARRAEIIQAAEDSGSTWEEIKANAGAILEAPFDSLVNAVGSSAPTLLTAVIPGLGQAGAVRFIAQGAVGAAQGMGAVKGSIYESVERELVKTGMSPSEAAKVAAGAQAYDGANQGQIALGGLLGLVAGTTGAEASAAKIAAGTGVASAAKTAAGKVAHGVIKEGSTEAAQGGQERLAANTALQNQGFDVPTWKGVAGQATAEGLAGGLMGGGFSAVEAVAAKHPNVPQELVATAEAASKPNSPASRAAMAGNTPAAVEARQAQAAAQAGAQTTQADPAARLAELEAVARGTEATTGPDGQATPGTPSRFLTPEEKAEYDQLSSLRDATKKIADSAQPQTDTVGQRVSEIEVQIRDTGILDTMRAEGADTKSLIKDLATAKSPSTSAAAREQALARVEYTLGWSGAASPAAAPASSDPIVAALADPQVSEADRQSLMIARGAMENPGLPAATREAARSQALEIAGRYAAPSSEPTAGQPAVLGEIAPADGSPEQAVAQAERFERGAQQFREAGFEPDAVPLQEQADSLREEAATRRADAFEATRVEDVPAPKVRTTPAGQGAAFARRRRATLDQLVADGLDRVERRDDGFYLVNQSGKRQHKLENAGDAQMARVAIAAAIRAGAAQANTSPTEAQKQAGNYKVGEVTFDGLTLAIENPQGSKRFGTDPNGERWETTMPANYGYVRGSAQAADGDKVDIYLPDTARAGSPAWIIDQYNDDGSFDETKTVLGVATEADALRIYDAGFSDGSGPRRRRGITSMPMEEFKTWVMSDAAKKPAAQPDEVQRLASDMAAELPNPDQVPRDPAEAVGSMTVRVNGKPVEIALLNPEQMAKRASSKGKPKTTQAQAKVLQSIADTFGKSVVFFDDATGAIGDGFVMPGNSSAIYLNQSTSVSPLAVFGHELMHLLEQDNPAAHAAVAEVVRERLKKGVDKKYRELGYGDGEILNEITSDLTGDLMSDPKFWSEVFDKVRDDGALAALIAMVRHYVAKLIASFKQPGFGSEKLVSDLESVRAAVRDAMATYARQRNENMAKLQARVVRAEQDIRRSDQGVKRSVLREQRVKDSTGEEYEIRVSRQMLGALQNQPAILVEARTLDGNRRGFIDFAVDGDTLQSENTLVAPPFRGRGLATLMYQAAADAGYSIAPGRRQTEMGAGMVRALQSRGVIGAGEITRSAARQTDTPEFKKWFGDSKVVDAQGRPMVVYHGTTADFSVFDAAKIKRKAAGVGFYFTTDREQRGYAEGEGASVMPVYLSIQNPTANPLLFRTDESYDGLIFPLTSTPGVTHIAVRRPEQIKSATGNRGTFDPTDADITRSIDRGIHYSKQPRERLDGRKYGTGMKGAEARRLAAATDPRIKERVYAYLDGRKPEIGVGGYAHEVNLPNLYDADRDPLRLWNSADLNAAESAVLDEGFDGYKVNGVAVVMGPASHNIAARSLNGTAAEEVFRRGLMSKEIEQIVVGNIPGASMRTGTLVVPARSRDLANAELARIGSNIRLSKDRLNTAKAEFDSVEKKLRGTDAWMKAPNGEPTKLTERQWVHVRTPSFKRWFGDWEAAHAAGGVWAAEDVSKAVGPNGEPLVVYHGSGMAGFAEFEQPIGTKRGNLGIFTTDNRYMAESYARRGRARTVEEGDLDTVDEDGNVEQADRFGGVYALFINTRNPNEDSFEGANWDGSRTDQWVVEVGGEQQYESDGRGYFTEEAAKEFAKTFQSPEDAEEGSDSYLDYVRGADDHWQTTDGVVREARVNGNDGAIIREVVDEGGGPSRFSGEPSDIFVALDPNQVKSADFNDGTYSLDENDIRRSRAREIPESVDDVTNVDAAFDFAGSRKFGTNRDFKLELQKRALEAAAQAKVAINGDDERTQRYLVRVGARDARTGLRDNSNAIGWYNDKVTKALRLVSLIHPEVASNPDSRFAFTWALAVTSNGMKVGKNFELAEAVYEAFRRTGKMPTDIKAGQTQLQINEGLRLFNELRDAWGMQELMHFATSRNKVRDIEKATGISITGEGKDNEVYGAAILGPKIGNGFFMNLYGQFDQLTMDRWLMRTWGRWTGTLVDVDRAKVKAKRDQLGAVVRMLTPAQKKEFEEILGSKLKVGELDAVAEAIRAASAKPELRERMNRVATLDAGQDEQLAEVLGKQRANQRRESLGGELRKLGNQLSTIADGQVEAPNGVRQRNFIRSVFSGILGDLQSQHRELTMADLQAVLWYPEKRLYDAAKSDETADGGYSDDEAPDYANAASALAARKGVPEQLINKTIKDVENELAAAKRTGAARRGAAEQGGDRQAAEQAGPAAVASRVRDAGGVRGSAEPVALDSRPQQSDRGTDLVGLPAEVKVDGRLVRFGGFKPAQDAARAYAAKAGIDYRPPTTYAKVDPARARRIAEAFEAMPHAPNDPEVKAAYRALINETAAQYQAMLDTGVQVEFIDGPDPYGNPRNAILDVTRNNHLWVYPTTDGFGGSASADIDITGNPLLEKTEFTISGRPALVNDLFRAVHDYFGHIAHGVGFRADGEENTWRMHAAMFSPQARRALTTETRGQNSWVNYGPHAEYNLTANGGDTQYAPQKIGLLPQWVVEEGRTDANESFDAISERIDALEDLIACLKK